MTSERLKRKPIVLHIITGLGGGGAEAVLYNLIRSAINFEHKIISLSGPGKYGPMMEAEGFEVFCLGLRSSLHSAMKLLKLPNLVRQAQPDVVQCWMYHADLLGGYAAWHANVRAIVWGLHHTTLDVQSTKWTTKQLVLFNARISSWLPHRIITSKSLKRNELQFLCECYVWLIQTVNIVTANRCLQNRFQLFSDKGNRLIMNDRTLKAAIITI